VFVDLLCSQCKCNFTIALCETKVTCGYVLQLKELETECMGPISFTNFNAQYFYSLTICMLHYNPRHVSSIKMPIFSRTNCIITASGIIVLYKRLHSMPDESRLQSSLLSSGILYCTVQRVTIPDAVIIQFFLLKMGMLMFETRRGL
jgi:hypothetical protein